MQSEKSNVAQNRNNEVYIFYSEQPVEGVNKALNYWIK